MREKNAQKIISDLQKNYNLVSPSFARSRDRLWPEAKFLFNRAKRNEKVLDLGCGNGRFSQYLEHVDYTGIDFSEKMIEEAKKRFPDKRFLVGSALDLPLKDESFDKIYGIAVFHHIPSHKYRIKALLEMKRVLKPGGFLFLTVWDMWKTHQFFCIKNLFFNFFLPSRGQRDVFFKGKRYYYLFKKKEISSLANKAGFEVEKEGRLKQKRFQNFYLIARKKV